VAGGEQANLGPTDEVDAHDEGDEQQKQALVCSPISVNEIYQRGVAMYNFAVFTVKQYIDTAYSYSPTQAEYGHCPRATRLPQTTAGTSQQLRVRKI
jgi:hypothetical protein